jgi:cobalt-precorrin 5A hydrolase/precorrin-3B C17-methyltransferase
MAGVNMLPGTGTPPAIVVLGTSALRTARRIQAVCPGSSIHGLQSRVDDKTDVGYARLGEHLQTLYAQGVPIVALCAAGIVIRCIAPLLADKGAEPPVLAVAEDGSAVVPLLGGLAGVNALARKIGEALDVAPAITTSGELRFGTCLLNPPKGYVLADLEQGKHFVSDLLSGERARIEGEAPWLDEAPIPRDEQARRVIRVTPFVPSRHRDELVIHPRSVVVCVPDTGTPGATAIREAMSARGLADCALAALLAPHSRMADPSLEATALSLDVPLRFIGNASDAALTLATSTDPRYELHTHANGVTLAVAAVPVDPAAMGHGRGRLSVVGLGPGRAGLMAPDARAALDAATDILGYETYVRMAGPFREGQQLHCTDNREELQRARHAFELASEGRQVVVVSSGDPGVFAMASAVFEALDTSSDARWKAVDLRI